MSGSWKGETAHSYARLRLEQTNPRPDNPQAWITSVARSVMAERPETFRMMEAEKWSPFRAAFWLVDHQATATTQRRGEGRQGADFGRIVPLGCERCEAGWVDTDAGVVPCPDCRTEAVA